MADCVVFFQRYYPLDQEPLVERVERRLIALKQAQLEQDQARQHDMAQALLYKALARIQDYSHPDYEDLVPHVMGLFGRAEPARCGTVLF